MKIPHKTLISSTDYIKQFRLGTTDNIYCTQNLAIKAQRKAVTNNAYGLL